MTYQNTRALIDLLASALPRRRAYQLLLAVALIGTGVSIASLSRGVADANARPIAAAAPAISGSESAIVVLPTIVVRPEPDIPTLATVTVRVGDGGATSERASTRALLPVHAVTSFASAGSAGSGFGMPYYSFGKPLRHGTEE